MNTTILNSLRASAVSIAILLAACASLPEHVDVLEQARTNLRSAEQDTLAREAASTELAAAREALSDADAAYDKGDDLDTVKYHAYIANRHAQIASQQIAEAHARQQLEDTRARRDEVLLQAREREAERQATRAEQAEQRAEQLSDRAESAEQRAEQLSEQVDDAEQHAEELAQQLKTVKAERTERGLVLTLDDILFDTDASNLKPGAASTLDELGKFLNEYPDRHVRIEGHADARGAASYNVELSTRRAEAVENALEVRGIDDERIEAVGLGEAYPVATNETPAGRQQNRRVELVLSDANGDFPRGEERTASLGDAG